MTEPNQFEMRVRELWGQGMNTWEIMKAIRQFFPDVTEAGVHRCVIRSYARKWSAAGDSAA